jgi:anaerobic magnesium-protoporphyrin IX monomethyl ester cyclase
MAPRYAGNTIERTRWVFGSETRGQIIAKLRVRGSVMKWALINPSWSFKGSIYFGCREPHLALEFQYARMLLEAGGHNAILIDGHLDGLSLKQIRQQVVEFRPDFTVVTSAPSYLFWRCAPPELRVPQELVRALKDVGGRMIVVGPHASTTPRATLTKLGVDAAVMGECEEVLRDMAECGGDWRQVQSICYRDGDCIRINGGNRASNMALLPALRWDDGAIRRHRHHHHRFDKQPSAPGAELEFSRGCPYHCTFCAKDNFRNSFRKRDVPIVLQELDGLIGAGAEYVYFIDEIFMPDRSLLEALAERPIQFGVQLRIDLWSPEMLDLLGRAGCVSIEAGVESITAAGREQLDKKCKLSTDELADRLIFAKQRVPFVQANLLESKLDDPENVERWRMYLQSHGVWANKPVPLFPYPGSPDYTARWGRPDDSAWERAHNHYLKLFDQFSDIQDERPAPLHELELSLSEK